MTEITISLPRITRYAYHGTEIREQTVGQLFSADVKVWLRAEKAARSDKIQDSVNYVDLYRKICKELEGKAVQLLEHLAYRIATRIMKQFVEIEKVSVRLSKPVARISYSLQRTSVRLSLSRQDIE